MSRSGRDGAWIDLGALPPEVRTLVESTVAGGELAVTSEGAVLGSLVFRPRVLDGEIIQRSREEEPAPSAPSAGVMVVATAMRLSASARARLSAELGDGYIVVDIQEAPASADVVLVPPVSTQLLAHLRRMFPSARIVVTEIDDEELGVRYGGQVGRLLDAGASAYLPAWPIAQVAAGLRAHVSPRNGAALGPASGSADGLVALTARPRAVSDHARRPGPDIG